jgi:hypothetical protein
MTVTALGRGQIEWPDLGTAGGAALETAIHGAVKAISDNLTGRFEAAVTLANAAFTEFEHNFNLPSSDLQVILYDDTTKERLTLEVGGAALAITYPDQNTVRVTNNGAAKTFDVLIIPTSVFRSVGQARNYLTISSDTPTALFTRPIPNNTCELLRAEIACYRGTSIASFELIYRAKNNSGTVTLSLVEKTVNRDVDTLSADMVVSGTNVVVQVTGEDMVSINWSGVLTTTKL